MIYTLIIGSKAGYSWTYGICLLVIGKRTI